MSMQSLSFFFLILTIISYSFLIIYHVSLRHGSHIPTRPFNWTLFPRWRRHPVSCKAYRWPSSWPRSRLPTATRWIRGALPAQPSDGGPQTPYPPQPSGMAPYPPQVGPTEGGVTGGPTAPPQGSAPYPPAPYPGRFWVFCWLDLLYLLVYEIRIWYNIVYKIGSNMVM